ncbi:MAG: hypothetical protein ACREQP_21670, partial [Candidatus Binatia bacterium]
LGLSRMYPAAINEIEEIKGMFAGESYPGAKSVAERLVTLPTHHLMTERDKEAICALFRSFEIQRSPASSMFGESAAGLRRDPEMSAEE